MRGDGKSPEKGEEVYHEKEGGKIKFDGFRERSLAVKKGEKERQWEKSKALTWKSEKESHGKVRKKNSEKE